MSEHAARDHGHDGRNPVAPPGDDLSWMARLSALSDREVDELLAGRVPDGAEDLAPLAHIAGSLRARAVAEPVPPMSAELVQQLAAPPVARLDARRPGGRSRVAVVAAAAALAAGSFGAAAAENALPGPIQDAVSSAADLVGVEVPRADERQSEAPPATTGGGAVPASPDDPGARSNPATPTTPAGPSTGATPELFDGHGRPGSVPSAPGAGQPDSTTDPAAGQPDSTAGQPDSTAGQPDSTAGQPDSTADPAAGHGGSPVGEHGGPRTAGPPASTPSTQPAPATPRR